MSDRRILSEVEAINVFQCIGIDNKRHSRVSWEKTTLCGLRITKSGPNWHLNASGCYDCDVIAEGRHWGEASKNNEKDKEKC